MAKPVIKTTQRPAPSKLLAIIVASLALAILVALSAQAIAKTSAQPNKTNMTSLQKQRQIVYVSLESYDPILNDFARQYTEAYNSEAPEESKAAIYKHTKNAFERETKINNQRISAMESSPALKDTDVKKQFDGFKAAYGEVTQFYSTKLASSSAALSVLNSDCKDLPRLNTTKRSHSEDFIKAADKCLKELESAKASTDSSTTELLTNFEAMVKQKKGLFEESFSAEGPMKTSKRTLALLSLIDWSKELGKFQAEYETEAAKQYKQLATKINSASTSFKDAITKRLAELDKSGEG